MSIPVAVNGVIGYLDDVPFGLIDDLDDAADDFADRPVGFIAIELGTFAMAQKKADGTWGEIE